MTTRTPKPFRREGSKIWHFKYTDRHGVRKYKSTGTVNKTEAQKIIRDFVDKLQQRPDKKKTLRQMVEMFCSQETNPRYQDSIAHNREYSPRSIEQITRNANHLYHILDKQKDFPFDMDMDYFERRDIKDFAGVITSEFGYTTKSQKIYKMLKMVFSQALDDGYCKNNPAANLPDIRVGKSKPIYSIPAEDISYAINHLDLFRSQRDRDIFTLIASTGMRKSEVLALCKEQLRPDGSLMIDRSWKDDTGSVVGLPKWNVKRVIPLSSVSIEAIERIFAEDDTLGLSSRQLYRLVKSVGERASSLHKDKLQRPEAWEHIYPHMLRRSLTTMLRTSGLSDILVAEYMSWSHQDQTHLESQDMLEYYTDIIVRDLQIVADKIDFLLSGKDNVIDMKSRSQQ